MKLIVLITVLAWTASTQAAEEPTTPYGNETVAARFSPFVVYDNEYALGTFAKVNWYQAQIACAAYGYTLVSINTEVDQQRLRYFIHTRAHDYLHLLDEPVWTSGTDLAEPDNWCWFSNGRPLSYRNFQTGSPSIPSGNQNCLGINGVTSAWLNEDCRVSRYFVCERRCAEGTYLYM